MNQQGNGMFNPNGRMTMPGNQQPIVNIGDDLKQQMNLMGHQSLAPLNPQMAQLNQQQMNPQMTQMNQMNTQLPQQMNQMNPTMNFQMQPQNQMRQPQNPMNQQMMYRQAPQATNVQQPMMMAPGMNQMMAQNIPGQMAPGTNIMLNTPVANLTQEQFDSIRSGTAILVQQNQFQQQPQQPNYMMGNPPIQRMLPNQQQITLPIGMNAGKTRLPNTIPMNQPMQNGQMNMVPQNQPTQQFNQTTRYTMQPQNPQQVHQPQQTQQQEGLPPALNQQNRILHPQQNQVSMIPIAIAKPQQQLPGQNTQGIQTQMRSNRPMMTNPTNPMMVMLQQPTNQPMNEMGINGNKQQITSPPQNPQQTLHQQRQNIPQTRVPMQPKLMNPTLARNPNVNTQPSMEMLHQNQQLTHIQMAQLPPTNQPTLMNQLQQQNVPGVITNQNNHQLQQPNQNTMNTTQMSLPQPNQQIPTQKTTQPLPNLPMTTNGQLQNQLNNQPLQNTPLNARLPSAPTQQNLPNIQSLNSLPNYQPKQLNQLNKPNQTNQHNQVNQRKVIQSIPTLQPTETRMAKSNGSQRSISQASQTSLPQQRDQRKETPDIMKASLPPQSQPLHGESEIPNEFKKFVDKVTIPSPHEAGSNKPPRQPFSLTQPKQKAISDTLQSITKQRQEIKQDDPVEKGQARKGAKQTKTPANHQKMLHTQPTTIPLVDLPHTHGKRPPMMDKLPIPPPTNPSTQPIGNIQLFPLNTQSNNQQIPSLVQPKGPLNQNPLNRIQPPQTITPTTKKLPNELPVNIQARAMDISKQKLNNMIPQPQQGDGPMVFNINNLLNHDMVEKLGGERKAMGMNTQINRSPMEMDDINGKERMFEPHLIDDSENNNQQMDDYVVSNEMICDPIESFEPSSDPIVVITTTSNASSRMLHDMSNGKNKQEFKENFNTFHERCLNNELMKIQEDSDGMEYSGKYMELIKKIISYCHMNPFFYYELNELTITIKANFNEEINALAYGLILRLSQTSDIVLVQWLDDDTRQENVNIMEITDGYISSKLNDILFKMKEALDDYELE